VPMRRRPPRPACCKCMFLVFQRVWGDVVCVSCRCCKSKSRCCNVAKIDFHVASVVFKCCWCYFWMLRNFFSMLHVTWLNVATRFFATVIRSNRSRCCNVAKIDLHVAGVVFKCCWCYFWMLRNFFSMLHATWLNVTTRFLLQYLDLTATVLWSDDSRCVRFFTSPGRPGASASVCFFL
jgi:hypothetical protein